MPENGNQVIETPVTHQQEEVNSDAHVQRMPETPKPDQSDSRPLDIAQGDRLPSLSGDE